MNGADPICGSKAYPTTTTTTTTTTTSTAPPTTTTSEETKTTTATTTWGYPSFFCVTLVQADSHELEILKRQLFRRTGIFACDEYAIFSDHVESQLVGTGPDGSDIQTIVIPPLKNAMNQQFGGSPCIETQAMLKVWDLVRQDGRYKRHDWVLKIDPSSVFLLDRLKGYVKTHTSQNTGLVLTTCSRFNLVLPSLEVFSVHAMELFFGRNQWQCGAEQQRQIPCEESFMTQCMDALGAKRINGLQLAGDPRCEAAPCTDDSRVLFRNNFQDAASWFKCFNEAIH